MEFPWRFDLNMKKNTWFWYAFATFFFFGITNFLLGFISEKSMGNPQASLTAIMVLWTGMGIMGAVTGIFFKISGRGFLGIPSKKYVFMAIIAGVTLSAGMLTLKLGFVTDPLAKGPIVAISATNSILVALLAWLIIKEKLSKFQVLGLLIIVSGISWLALSNTSSASFLGFLFGLATMGLFGATNFLLKYAGHKGTHSISAAVILWLASGACGVIALGISFLFGRGLAGISDPILLVIAFIAGITLGSGMLTIKIAVTKGPAGPAIAISGCNALMVTLLDWMVFHHLPSHQKVIGMLVALTGMVILSLSQKTKRTPNPS
jgi:drug/metabolite transporter (DMT)-like permease